MTKTELIAALAQDSSLTKRQAETALDSLTAIVAKALADGLAIKLPGLGTLEPRDSGPRAGHNPRTGADITIPAQTRVAFVTSSTLKRHLNP